MPIIQVAVWAFLLTAVVPVQAEELDSTVGDPQGLAHPHADACVWTGGACEWDYHMQAMTAVFEQGREETFYAYVEPDVATYYNQTEGSMRVVEPDFNGMFMKFVNVSPMSVRVHWVPANYPNEDLVYICDIEPFGAAGTTAYPNHKFQMTRQDKPDKIVTTFTATKGQNIYAFEPFQGDYGKAYQKLKKPADFQNYILQHNNLLFAEQYKEKTGREWLALYGHRSPPHFHMWPAESLGQTHTITTKEIHFVDLPPAEELAKGISLYGPRPEEITRNRKHRDTYPTMNLTLTVLSAAPRVFEIQNFLSDVEIEHILSIADQTELSKSTTKAGSAAYAQDDETTRTSTNAWMGRHESIVLDAIYRRAADVLQIDEKFLRYRRKLEIPEFSESKVGIAESLQLVHYDVGQKYVSFGCFYRCCVLHSCDEIKCSTEDSVHQYDFTNECFLIKYYVPYLPSYTIDTPSCKSTIMLNIGERMFILEDGNSNILFLLSSRRTLSCLDWFGDNPVGSPLYYST